MGETYSNPHEVHNHGDSSSTPATTTSTIATLDGSVDEPPIRSAGSSHHLTEKSGGETRFTNKNSTLGVVIDQANIATCAHILTSIEVARRLETDDEFVDLLLAW
jgi:Na+-exporting ATPase